MKHLKPKEAVEFLQKHPQAVFVDCRSEMEYLFVGHPVGAILIPWYEGERTPDLPLAAPLTFGFGPGDFTPEIFCRAVLEGHVLNLQHGFSKMPVRVREIRLTGGLSQSPAWRQTIADIFGAETVPVMGEGAALGAALHAAWVWLNEHGEAVSIRDVVSRFVRLDEKSRCRPDSAAAPVIALQRRLFAALSRRLRGLEGEDPFQLRATLREYSG
mgnify:CR=1 FL=1